MRIALRLILGLLGAAAIAIAASIMLLGAEATASMAEHGFQSITGYDGPASGHWPPSMDSELRFYAALWGAYGIVLITTAVDLTRHMNRVPWLAIVFFAGGAGRVVSHVQLGAPHPFFVLLMASELLLPVLILVLWLGVRRRAHHPGD